MDITPYLKMMIRHSASDLFFVPGAPAKIEIDGVMRSIGETSLTPAYWREAVASVLTEDLAKELDQALEIDFAIALKGRGRFRVNAYHQRSSRAMILRYIRATIPTLEELDLPLALSQLVMHKRGVILMVGATGSGKSTTLAAMIDHRYRSAPGHIVTIEDPIEFLRPHRQCLVSQRELGLDTKSYGHALKSALREASDVILIGEIRTRETMEAAIELAGTGHLAISTLHANNAYQAMTRIREHVSTSHAQNVVHGSFRKHAGDHFAMSGAIQSRLSVCRHRGPHQYASYRRPHP